MIELRLGRLDIQIAGQHVTLIGRLDESATLAMLVSQLPAGDLAIDTGGVTFVNSVGMRAWIRLVRMIRDRGSAVILDCVADVLMTQMNLIPEFATTVAIRSFHAQYVCAACGCEAAPLVDALANAQVLSELRAPRLPCPECGAAMDLADFPERYLSIFMPRA